MKRHLSTLFFASAVAMVATILLSAASFSFSGAPPSSKQRKRNLRRLSPSPMVVMDGPGEPVPKFFGYNPNLLPQKREPVYESMEHRLRSIPVSVKMHPDWKSPPKLATEVANLIAAAHLFPENRLSHFSWLSSNPRFRINSWGGFLVGMESTPEGIIATVQMGPVVSTSGGRSASTADHLMERYLIVNGRVHFIGATEPDGDYRGEPIVG